ncbi:DNase I-like protein [Phlegmacium glaucopus]|nr:DNase I-like protein [Phlegmacium glaucopus]
MRVVTWNINGVRTLPQYHPWNTLKSHDDILNYLNADIICFQEVKSSRQALPKPVALPPSYDSFFSFPVRKAGYSGVATYTRRSTLVPNKAEEGLTGLIQPKPPLATEERISKNGNYPSSNLVDDLTDDEEEFDFKDLDSEGRAVVVDVGLFVLINVYCPNTGTGTDEREIFKKNYHKVLEARVDALIKEGREVMVVGDLNACAAVQDHCEGSLLVARGLAEGLHGEEGFWGADRRGYIRDWLIDAGGTGGCMVDIVRRFWPTRKGMYTCWNTKISARESNYGTRIDFILITPNLIPWIAAADIQPEMKGSDHCPVFVDFRDEITDANGITIKLQDVLGVQATPGEAKEPPRLAAKFWAEYSGKQMLLEKFFGKQPVDTQTVELSPTPVLVSDASLAAEPSDRGQSSLVAEPSFPSSSECSITPSPSTTAQAVPPPASLTSKRKITAETTQSSKKSKTIPTRKNETTKAKEKTPGQSTIASFFSQPKATKSQITTASASVLKLKGKETATGTQVHGDNDLTTPSDGLTQVDEDADYRLALLLSSQDSISSLSQDHHAEKETKQAWNNLLAPIQAPKCVVHREPAKEFTVNKQGPNKGKRFFICSRPVGPGYDKGRSERLREQVDHQWRCDFFKWSSDVRKEMMMKKGNT